MLVSHCILCYTYPFYCNTGENGNLGDIMLYVVLEIEKTLLFKRV